MKKFLNGVSAGVLISVGCTVYLASPNKIVGAILFSIALLATCFRNYSLFTGRIGYIINNHKKEDFLVLFLGLLGNAVAVVLCGLLISIALPDVSNIAKVLCESKLETQSLLQTFIRAIFCGVLMFVAVSTYKENKTIVGILFAIPTFVLAGFEHSIADIGYFAIANMASLEVVLYIVVVLFGNAIGSFILVLLEKFGKSKEKEEIKEKEETHQ